MTLATIRAADLDGFAIRYEFHPEHIDPRGDFCSGDDAADAETLAMIENGLLEWFRVECIASKAGVDLGSDHLGACCYESFQAFIDAGDYAADMRSEAIREARTTLTTLCAAA